MFRRATRLVNASHPDMPHRVRWSLGLADARGRFEIGASPSGGIAWSQTPPGRTSLATTEDHNSPAGRPTAGTRLPAANRKSWSVYVAAATPREDPSSGMLL
jgi:hypothetical protein